MVNALRERTVLIDGMTNDPKDRHVLAAAVRVNAEVSSPSTPVGTTASSVVTWPIGPDLGRPRADTNRAARCLAINRTGRYCGRYGDHSDHGGQGPDR